MGNRPPHLDRRQETGALSCSGCTWLHRWHAKVGARCNDLLFCFVRKTSLTAALHVALARSHLAVVPARHALGCTDALAIVGLVDQSWVICNCDFEVDVFRAEVLGLLQVIKAAAEHEWVLLHHSLERTVLSGDGQILHKPVHDRCHFLVRGDVRLSQILHVQSRGHLRDANLGALVLQTQGSLQVVRSPVEVFDERFLGLSAALGHVGVLHDLFPHVKLLHQPPFPEPSDHRTLHTEVLLDPILEAAHGRPGRSRPQRCHGCSCGKARPRTARAAGRRRGDHKAAWRARAEASLSLRLSLRHHKGGCHWRTGKQQAHHRASRHRGQVRAVPRYGRSAAYH